MLRIVGLKRFDDNIWYLQDYHPYKEFRNEQNEFDKRIMDIKSENEHDYSKAIPYFREHITPVLDWDFPSRVVICVVPPSTARKTSNLNKVVELVSDNIKFINGTHILIRSKTVPKAHIDMNRTKGKHKDSIKISNPTSIKNENILLIDDVITSGQAMREVSQILCSSGAKRVVCLGLGRTVHRDDPTDVVIR